MKFKPITYNMVNFLGKLESPIEDVKAFKLVPDKEFPCQGKVKIAYIGVISHFRLFDKNKGSVPTTEIFISQERLVKISL